MARARPRSTGPSAGDETRARIVEAALQSLRDEGILGASARAIARQGDFNQALIFYHFGTINELLLAAVDELSARRTARYEDRLGRVSSLRELVDVAGELHSEDLEEGHMTVLSQMLAGAATDDELRGPLKERFEPWIALVERSVARAVAGTPYETLVPVRDLALAVTALFVGLELMLNLEDEASRREHHIFQTFAMLAGVLEALMAVAPPETGRA
jgi:AcrR family transcriptional regulator